MTHPYFQVLEFHEAFDAPVGDEQKPSLDFERLQLRFDLVAEEFCELVEALYGEFAAVNIAADIEQEVKWITKWQHVDPRKGDIVGVADALADLDYVIAGFAVEAGIPLDSVAEEVHRSNMSKLGEDGKPILREDGKILKGPGYSAPDIKGVLFR